MAARSSTPPLPLSTGGVAPAKWICDRCGVPNASASLKCSGCTTPRPNAAGGAANGTAAVKVGVRPPSRNAVSNITPMGVDPLGLGGQKRFSSAPIAPVQLDQRQQQKRVVEALRSDRKVWTPTELKVHTSVAVLENPSLIHDLRSHAKVKVNQMGQDYTFEYKPLHPGIRNASDLDIFLRANKLGVPEPELDDAYIGVADDIKALAKEEKIYRIVNTETKKACLYCRVRLREEVPIDERIQELWHKVTMPLTDGQLEEKLIKSGHMQKQQKAGPVAVMKEKKSNARKKRRIKMTNTHLVGLGLGAWVDNMGSA